MKKTLAIILAVLMAVSMMTVFAMVSSAGTQELGFWGSGMENWGGSPNKGDAAEVYQILLRPTIDGSKDPFNSTDIEWTLKITDGTNTKTIKGIKPATIYDAGTIVRFEPALETGDKFFVAEVGKTYTITASCELADGTKFEATKEGASINVDPANPSGAQVVWDAPGTGDVAVIAVVLAVVALAGTAIVVKKVRV